MALGNNNYRGNNQNGNSQWEPSYYSRLRIKNSDGLTLGFTFWKGTLRLNITEFTNGSNGDNRNDLAIIHLSPTKARIMADAVSRVIATKENVTYGVDTGSGEVRGFIAIGKEANVPYLFIAKVNSKGEYESSQRFNFSVDYNYMLDVHDITNLKIQKEYMNDVELQQLHDLFEDYARAASGAIGASVNDINRYEAAKVSNMIRKVADKVGVQLGRGGNGNNSFFNNVEDNDYEKPNGHDRSSNSSNRSRYDSIDDLENALG